MDHFGPSQRAKKEDLKLKEKFLGKHRIRAFFARNTKFCPISAPKWSLFIAKRLRSKVHDPLHQSRYLVSEPHAGKNLTPLPRIFKTDPPTHAKISCPRMSNIKHERAARKSHIFFTILLDVAGTCGNLLPDQNYERLVPATGSKVAHVQWSGSYGCSDI